MKKLVLLLAVVFSVSLFSCGNKDKAAEATDVVEGEVVEAVVDSIAPDSVEVAVAVDSVAPEAAPAE